jgi:hypothetical protein
MAELNFTLRILFQAERNGDPRGALLYLPPNSGRERGCGARRWWVNRQHPPPLPLSTCQQCSSAWVCVPPRGCWGAYFCVPVCQLLCLCHWSAWRWQCGWVNPFVSLSPEGGGLSSCRLQLGNPSQRELVGVWLEGTGRKWAAAWGRGSPRDSAVGGGSVG